MRSSEIRKSLNIEPLFLRIERSQFRWFGHVSRMPHERLPKQALLAKANGRRPKLQHLDVLKKLKLKEEAKEEKAKAKRS